MEFSQELIHILKSSPLCSSASDIKVHPLKGDASSRSYYRVISDNKSLIFVNYPQKNQQEEMGSKLVGRSALSDFIDTQALFIENRIKVPKIIDSFEKPKGLLLEDFGDELLISHCAKKPNEIESMYGKALKQLQHISSLGKKLQPTHFIKSRSFGVDLLFNEFLHFTDCALDKELKQEICPEYETLKSIFHSISMEISSWPEVVSHRDFHSRNIMILENGEVGIIDFQDALMGPIVYDLASLLRDSYIDLGKELREKLLRKFFNELKDAELEGGISFDGFMRRFNLMGMQRNLKAAGRFFFFNQSKGNANYLPDVPRTLSYISDSLDTLEEFDGVKSFFLDRLNEVSEKAKEKSCKP